MTVHADTETCIGAGTCTATAGAVFDQDDTGTVVLKICEVASALIADVRDAVRRCPSGALSITE